MPFIRYRAQNVLFVHIPKTGGTPIGRWMQSLGELCFYNQSRPEFSRVTPQHLRIADIDELLGEKFFQYVFAIVRNPFTRVASEYRMRCTEAKAQLREAPVFSGWLQNNLHAYRRNPFHLDNHLRPQSEFLSERVRLFRFEDGLQTILGNIAQEIDAPSPGLLAPKLPRDMSEIVVRFDPTDVEQIVELYGRDFDRLGYSKSPPASA